MEEETGAFNYGLTEPIPLQQGLRLDPGSFIPISASSQSQFHYNKD